MTHGSWVMGHESGLIGLWSWVTGHDSCSFVYRSQILAIAIWSSWVKKTLQFEN